MQYMSDYKNGLVRQEIASARPSHSLERIADMVFLLFYGLMFYIAYRDYVSVEWGYTGLSFGSLSGYEIALITIAIALQGWVMPPVINSPSAVVLWMLTLLIYVPTMIITIMVGERMPSDYYGNLAALSAVMIIASVFSRKTCVLQSDPMPPDRFFYVFAVIFFMSTALLFYQYRGIMSFSSVEDVYYQRFLAADLSGSTVIGYIRTHYLYVFSSTLFCAVLMKRKYWYFVPIGLLGYVVTYMIDASKIAFVIPILIFAFFAVQKFANSKTWVLNAGMAVLTILCGTLATYFSGIKLFADLVLYRSIAIPAQTFGQYSDVFGSRGYTWWSHVRGINYLVPPPQSFASDPFWPVLGQIVGAEFYGMDSRMNLNANLFAGEGVAAAGSLGVIAIGFAMLIWLRTFDWVARGWNQKMAVLISVPLGMSITNTHLSTFLLSFGGIFWLALMYFYKPGKPAGRKT
ncbi:hypothetical protein MNQ96_13420 [Sphingopyxis granuli]|uniref:hypothetical protein n=1 Tax=Sphingopyxis granuli TaxID=267128 RepID=UPI001F539D9A|nr:hypothetical protein [Sphingopyxis granuli]UNK78555.1 hypothetical protein MNQ96_13420 [Sphingopyxis granuli]